MKVMKNQLSRFAISRGVFLVTLVWAISVQALTDQVAANYPDTCRKTDYSNAQKVDAGDTDFGTKYKIIAAPSVLDHLNSEPVPVVAIVNANSINAISNNNLNSGAYDKLSEHLANNGYLVIVIQRKNINVGSTEQVDDVLNVIEKVYEDYGMAASNPLALVGHSVGGGVVMQAAKHINHQQRDLSLQALITLAPKAQLLYEGYDPLTAMDVPAYLNIYGSQDKDLGGTADDYTDFAAYDYVSNEYSTVPNGSNIEGELFKAMLYIHGADHKGLIGLDEPDGNEITDDQFISNTDQLCITKAYVTAFLNWHLNGHSLYRDFFSPPYVKPISVGQIKSSSIDYMEHPAGTPLRQFFQSNAVKRFVIQSFEQPGLNDYQQYQQMGLLDTFGEVEVEVIGKEELKTNPHYIRNVTNKLVLRWPEREFHQHLSITVPGSGINASQFSHFSIRIGQVWNSDQFIDGDLYQNPPASYQHIVLALRDADNEEVFTQLDVWGDIPFNDVRSSGLIAHTGMNTIGVPLHIFRNKVDLTRITHIGLVFSPETRGTIVLDNIEWSEYY